MTPRTIQIFYFWADLFVLFLLGYNSLYLQSARTHAHLTWRGTVGHTGAVLVGAGTAIKDRPRLTVRSAQTSTTNTNEQREVKQPLRIVIDGRGSVNDPTTPLLAQGGPNGEARTVSALIILSHEY